MPCCHILSLYQQTSFAVMIFFMIAWIPYAAVCTWRAVSGDEFVPIWATVLPVLCAKSSTLFNPAIYMIFNKQFREEVTILFSCFGFKCCGFAFHTDYQTWDEAVHGLLGGKRFHLKCGFVNSEYRHAVTSAGGLLHAQSHAKLARYDARHGSVYISRGTEDEQFGGPNIGLLTRGDLPYVVPERASYKPPSNNDISEEESSCNQNIVGLNVKVPVEVLVHAPVTDEGVTLKGSECKLDSVQS